MNSFSSGAYQSKHVLVTGGSGFIGSHLTDRLVAAGARVTIIDDLSTGDTDNIADHLESGAVNFIHSTVSQCDRFSERVAESDIVIHLAAAVGVDLVVNSPVRTIHNNLKETETVFEAAIARKTPVLMASTSEVYGKSSGHEFSETDDLLIGPPHLGRWSYACSKLMDEFMAMAYAQEFSLPVRIVRFFNTVGPRQTGRFGMVIPRFVHAALNANPIRVFGDGRQSRCFCHVHDSVEAVLRLMEAPRASGEVVNIGSTCEISIIELAHRVIKVLDSPSSVELIPYDEAYRQGFQDMQRRKPSIDKLFSLTGFKPSIDLDTIILDTAEFLSSHKNKS